MDILIPIIFVVIGLIRTEGIASDGYDRQAVDLCRNMDGKISWVFLPVVRTMLPKPILPNALDGNAS